MNSDRPLNPAPRGARRPLAFGAAISTLLVVSSAFALSETLRSAEDSEVAAIQDAEVPAHTAKAVAAANTFLRSLDEKLRTKASFGFDSDLRSRWTNLPGPRNGVRMGEMTKEQQAAALEVVAAVTSKEGYQKIRDIIAGDDALAKGGGKGPKDGKGFKDGEGKDGKGFKDGKGKGGKGGGFGYDNFYLAIFGKPSPTAPWLIEFGGHHLGINITVIGKDFVLTPTLTCAQPSSFERDGKTVRPLGVESDTAFKLMGSLNEQQRAQAVLKNPVNDLQLGPGQDGRDLRPAGLKGADMTDAQRALLTDLAAAWVTILHETSAKGRMDEIRAGIKDTYFAWSGPTADGSAAYFRVQGPTVVIEYAPQGSTNHIHTVVRELGNDYGKKLLAGK
jgi:Protein of unknown function (DUF3500)